MTSQKRIQFVLKDRYAYGQKTKAYGLYNSCNFVSRTLESIGHVTDVVQVLDANGIDREVHRFRPTDCFIEALWCVPSKIKELSRLHPQVRWHIRIHSKTPFLAVEGIAFEWLRKYAALRGEGVDVMLSPNTTDLAHELEMVFPGCVNHTPNMYNPSEVSGCCSSTVISKGDGELHIGLFGALRPLKNHLQQAMWAIEFANRHGHMLKLHINSSEHESAHTAPVLRNIRNLFGSGDHALIEHEWMSHDRFLRLVSQMDLGMQVSFSETYNIVSADFVWCGVPIVSSPDVPFVNPFCRVHPGDSSRALRVMGRAMRLKSLLCPLNSWMLGRCNSRALHEWENTLDS